jgi:hypothetical protein
MRAFVEAGGAFWGGWCNARNLDCSHSCSLKFGHKGKHASTRFGKVTDIWGADEPYGPNEPFGVEEGRW